MYNSYTSSIISHNSSTTNSSYTKYEFSCTQIQLSFHKYNFPIGPLWALPLQPHGSGANSFGARLCHRMADQPLPRIQPLQHVQHLQRIQRLQ